jgi:hypothetical protein
MAEAESLEGLRRTEETLRGYAAEHGLAWRLWEDGISPEQADAFRADAAGLLAP